MTIAGCVDCKVEGKWEEPNQGQGHPLKNFFKDNWCPECQESWEARQWEVSRGRVTKVQCRGCGKIDAIPGRLRMEEIRDMRCLQCEEKREERSSAI